VTDSPLLNYYRAVRNPLLPATLLLLFGLWIAYTVKRGHESGVIKWKGVDYTRAENAKQYFKAMAIYCFTSAILVFIGLQQLSRLF
jgi:hypothetical protein